jgi:hypothetical protein
VSTADITDKNLTLIQSLFSISGTISVSGGGSPQGATVQLKKDGGNAGNPVYAESGGAYTISGVTAGTYTIAVSLEGYGPGTIGPITVTNANVTSKDLALIATPTYLYTVSGTIYLKNGYPAAGASVKLRSSGSSQLAETTTDQNGCYTIGTNTDANVGYGGGYLIRAKGDGHQYYKDSAYFNISAGVFKTMNVTLNY